MATKKKEEPKKKAPAKKPQTKKKAQEPEMPENIWEKLPTETNEQYMKFCLYRDMAYQGKPEEIKGSSVIFGRRLNKRSLRKLAEQIGLKTHKPLEQLSSKNDWQSRCEAYDLDLDRRAQQAQQEAVIKMREDHALLAAQMIRKATSRLLKIPEDEISASDIVRLADVGVKIERLSRGESTENQNVSGNIKGTVKVSVQAEQNLEDLSDEELGELERLLGKIHPKSGV